MTALPSPKLRHIYRVDANLDTLVDLGKMPEGHRRIIAWTGGRAEGPYFHAEVLGTGGADWQIVRPSGSSVADIRYTLKTDRGALLYIRRAAYAMANQTCSHAWPLGRPSTPPNTRSAPR
jgi:hypothetical protein